MFLLKKIIIFLSAWETIEGSVEGSVAMDTSSPWGQESAESTAASPRGQQSVQAAAVVEQQVFPFSSWFLLSSMVFLISCFCSARRQPVGQILKHFLEAGREWRARWSRWRAFQGYQGGWC